MPLYGTTQLSLWKITFRQNTLKQAEGGNGSEDSDWVCWTSARASAPSGAMRLISERTISSAEQSEHWTRRRRLHQNHSRHSALVTARTHTWSRIAARLCGLECMPLCRVEINEYKCTWIHDVQYTVQYTGMYAYMLKLSKLFCILTHEKRGKR